MARTKLIHKIERCQSSTVEDFACLLCNFKTDIQIVRKYHHENYHKNQKGLGDYTLPSYSCEKCSFQTFSLLVSSEHADNCGGGSVTTLTLINLNEGEEYNENKNQRVMNKRICGNCSCTTYTKNREERNENKKNKCDQCNYVAKNIKRIDLKWFKCEKCLYQTVRKLSLLVHYVYKHKDKKGKLHVKEISKNTKNMKGTDENAVIIEECHENIKDVEHCEKTKNIEDNNENTRNRVTKKRKCDQCLYVAKNYETMRKHIYKVHPKWFQCDKCTYKTVRKWHLLRHGLHVHKDEKEKLNIKENTNDIKNIETNENIVIIEECNANIKDAEHRERRKNIEVNNKYTRNENIKYVEHCEKRKNIEDHNEYTRNRITKKRKCDQCHYVAKNYEAMRKHIYKVHPKWFQCDKCPYRTVRKWHLPTHNSYKHKDEKENVNIKENCSNFKNIEINENTVIIEECNEIKNRRNQ